MLKVARALRSAEMDMKQRSEGEPRGQEGRDNGLDTQLRALMLFLLVLKDFKHLADPRLRVISDTQDTNREAF